MTHHLDKVLRHALDDGNAVLTVNRRLARSLRLAYDAEKRADGALSWETPDILSLSAWTRRGWEEYGSETPLPVLLGPAQEQALWERIIREGDEAGEGRVLLPARMAQDARAAWMRIKAWRIPDSDMDSHPAAGGIDTMFSRWAQTFSRRCETHQWIDSACALDRLIRAIRAQAFRVGPMVLVGFEEFTPQQQDLLDALGLRAKVLPDEEIPPSATRVPRSPSSASDLPPAARISLPDQEQELECAARWARALLEGGDPDPIGIAVPGLAGMRPTVARVFQEILCPEALEPHADVPRPFQISLGQPLMEAAPIRDAMLALGLAEGAHPLPVFSRLLLSPYFAGAKTEFTSRARLDVSLRAMGEPWLTLETVCRHLDSNRESKEQANREEQNWSLTKGEASPLLAGLPRMSTALRGSSPRRMPSQWARAFAEWLSWLGWPGERALDGDEYQAVAAFYDLLAEFARLDLVLAEQGFQDAWFRLRRMATTQLFQPDSNLTPPNLAPIRILDISEIAGLWFSHLWVLGLHAEAWPAAPRPNPFLAEDVQQRLGMSGGGPDIELARARRTTEQILASADQIIVSYPRSDGDLVRYPSPLIAGLPEIAAREIPRSPLLDIVQRFSGENGTAAERLFDERGPAIGHDEPITGGARIWRDQAACPFRAFATHRLGAVALGVPGIGPDHLLRGMVTHRALELIWRELRDSDRLLSMTDDTLRAKVSEVVCLALGEAARRRPETFRGNRARELEQARLETLIMAWLEYEKERPPFTVVARERERVVSFGGAPVVIRVDRVDRVEGGEHLLLDYKTGDAGIGGWFGERPAEPQLPLYAILDGYDGIGFALVRRGGIGFEGIARIKDMAPRIETVQGTKSRAAKGFRDWDALRGEWHRILLSLAEAFARGDAAVDPKSPQESCRNCDLPSLCRIHGILARED
uniref:Probable DNA repair protein n=1 Tax=Candidatus Kentrum sp. LPFa TaxID=2126335 RepID=A0A450WUF6_9GAMM|nr:MAG: probable DNA repair protein [Candidatus Kentron sp. LPFa]